MTASSERFNLPPMVNVPPAARAPDDLYLMVLAWNSGSDDQREAALDCADRNRIAAVRLPDITITETERSEHVPSNRSR